MQCEALKHALLTLSYFTSTSSRNCKQTEDLKRGIRGRLASLARNCKQTVIQAPPCLPFDKFTPQSKF